jgi:hypothetical protein
MTMKKWAAIESSIEALTFIKKIIYTTFQITNDNSIFRKEGILTRKLYLVAVRNSVLYNIINPRDFYLI